MIEPTDEMAEAGWDALPVVVRESGEIDLDDMKKALTAVLAIVERDWDVRKPLCLQSNPHDWSAPCELLDGHDGEHSAEVRKQVHW